MYLSITKHGPSIRKEGLIDAYRSDGFPFTTGIPYVKKLASNRVRGRVGLATTRENLNLPWLDMHPFSLYWMRFGYAHFYSLGKRDNKSKVRIVVLTPPTDA